MIFFHADSVGSVVSLCADGAAILMPFYAILEVALAVGVVVEIRALAAALRLRVLETALDHA